MITAVSRKINNYQIYFRKNNDKKYNQFGDEKLLRDPNNPSNLKITKVENKKDKNNRLKAVATICLATSAIFYGFFNKSKMY